ncbi:hypothetical protein PSHT_11488 [Puccinia striiformis]|uniref:Uncharacterized protein n=1 Tax=Puccinia striiformis TaxID=27350 RepID=A0A2S4V2S9_9BASI|nr:hypothetical protein PSHT_11488 [Puccinia striiformis]
MKIHSLFSSLPVVILILGESLYVHSFNCQHPKTDGYTQALCATEQAACSTRHGLHCKAKEGQRRQQMYCPEQNSCCNPTSNLAQLFIHAKGLDLVCDYV